MSASAAITTRCADCKRSLIKPALTIGRSSFGPVCAKRYYIKESRTWPFLPTPVRRPMPQAEVDPRQLALQLDATPTGA
ncbi:MAG: hypothetical protein Q8N17_26200 [Burkholderiaceae bacterium]|nr:hypothetical protein [Burkholderiaceae bacterium]